MRSYAQSTGRRIFVTPNYFAAGKDSRFTQPERFNSIYFEYPWSEIDRVELKLPEGFALDHGDTPKGLGFAPIGTYSVSIGLDQTKNLIVYERRFIFGKDTALLFKPELYPRIKALFDQIREADNHLLTLKTEVRAGQVGVDK